MDIIGPGKRLRIIVGETKKWRHVPLYRAILEKALEEGIAGATAWHGVAGFGAGSRLHTAHILRLSEDLPVVIEITDRADRINNFIAVLNEMVVDGLIVVDDVEILRYGSH